MVAIICSHIFCLQGPNYVFSISRADFCEEPILHWMSKLSSEVKMAIKNSKFLIRFLGRKKIWVWCLYDMGIVKIGTWNFLFLFVYKCFYCGVRNF